MKDGTDRIIETKGRQQSGHSKNIDPYAKNKFIAFKEYANKYNFQWGVRDFNEEF